MPSDTFENHAIIPTGIVNTCGIIISAATPYNQNVFQRGALPCQRFRNMRFIFTLLFRPTVLRRNSAAGSSPRLLAAEGYAMSEIEELRQEVVNQWYSNHLEHCGFNVIPWPHHHECCWPLPPVIAALDPNEVYLLLLEVSGESSEFR